MSEAKKYDEKLLCRLRKDWDSENVEYSLKDFPFTDWLNRRVKHHGWEIEDLTKLHEVVPASESAKLAKKLIADTNLPEFRKLAHKFVKEVLVKSGDLRGEIALQRFFNVRIMRPYEPEMIIHFHTGVWYGHGAGSRSIWLPLTDVSQEDRSTASMQIMKLDKSLELIEYCQKNRMSNEQMQELFLKEVKPVVARPGQVHLFNQFCIHGNVVNTSDRTRISIDFRVAEEETGDQLARKWPGGYFELLADAELKLQQKEVKHEQFSADEVLSYQNTNTSYTNGIPFMLQRYQVANYCERNNIQFKFEHIDLEQMPHLPMLQHLINNDNPKAIVLFSIYSLPENESDRKELLDTALKRKIVLHFANEDEVMDGPVSRDRIDRILNFAGFNGKGSVSLKEVA